MKFPNSFAVIISYSSVKRTSLNCTKAIFENNINFMVRFGKGQSCSPELYLNSTGQHPASSLHVLQ